MSDRKTELIESAAIGINVYLRSTRGAFLCGANARIDEITGNSIVVIVKDDRSDSGHPEVILFTVAGD